VATLAIVELDVVSLASSPAESDASVSVVVGNGLLDGSLAGAGHAAVDRVRYSSSRPTSVSGRSIRESSFHDGLHLFRG